MQRLENLWKCIADDLAMWCCTSATLDFKRVKSRVEHEGLSFLTITLPAFAKDFEKCLEQGYVDSSAFVGFQRRQGPLPLFLGGFLNQVFDRESGLLLDDPSIDCIFAVRQLTMLCGKMLVPCSEERERAAMEGYVRCEEEVQEADESIPSDTLMEFRRISVLLFSDACSAVDRLLSSGDLRPRHGPGATADRLRGNAKYDQREWPLRLERVFPFSEHVLPRWGYYNHQQARVNFLEPDAERPVKVISVPKTLKTPRIIAVEPTCMQYMQQAILTPLVESLQSRVLPGNTRENLCYGFIGFTDQEPNRHLARLGSETGHLATLDLSEASDRVSNVHVVNLLSRFPHLLEATQVTRSTKAHVPGFGIIPLSKFASMGSALCFPMESMVFLTTIFLGIQNALGRPVTRSDILKLRGQVRVYGDDIIVPVDYVRHVIDALSLFGFKVNVNKSYWNGKFRESCGGDYYDGQDVTPVRLRRPLPSSRADGPEVISLVAFRNLLYFRGMWRAASEVDRYIGKILPHFPTVSVESPALGRHSFLGYETQRMCPELHRPLVKAYVVRSVIPESPISWMGALRKCLSKDGNQPFEDEQHLERQGRPAVVGIKLRWTTPF